MVTATLSLDEAWSLAAGFMHRAACLRMQCKARDALMADACYSAAFEYAYAVARIKLFISLLHDGDHRALV